MSDKFKYTAGLNNVGCYQVAGAPYVTASVIAQGAEKQIEFPRVTNNINVKLNENIYNSVFIEGENLYYVNASPSNASNGDSRTITAWISASVDNNWRYKHCCKQVLHKRKKWKISSFTNGFGQYKKYSEHNSSHRLVSLSFCCKFRY